MAAPTTLTFTDSPLSGRLRFRMRITNNWLFAVVIMVPAAFFFSQLPFGYLADVVVIGLLYCLVTFVLNDRAIKIRCPHCRKILQTNTPWVCGFCQRKNEHANDFPFVHRCEHCSAEPKAYQCHHSGCHELIYLTEDSQDGNYAHCVEAPVEDKAPKEIAERNREKGALIHEIEMTELASKLNATKSRLDMGKKKSPREEIEEDFARHFASRMGAREYAREKKAANAEQYKDDPELREMADATVDDWLRMRI